EMVAYHLASSGRLDHFVLPENATSYGTWRLADGRLQLTALPGINGNGFRWDGAQFVPLEPAPARSADAKSAHPLDEGLTEDDLDADSSDDGVDSGFLPKSQRKLFKDAGWHYKFLNGYAGPGGVAQLPVTLTSGVFNLSIESFLLGSRSAAQFDIMAMGTKSIRLAGDKLASGPQTLWEQSGWRDISKQDYQALQRQYGHNTRMPLPSMIWLLFLAFLVLWRFGSWIHILFSFATIKGRVLKNMATSYSFPPATPAQFPALDIAGLDRYTREFEGMGFT